MKPHRSRSRCVASLLLALFWASPAVFAADTPALIGNWALTIPGGGAGWLGVSGPAGTPQAAILWGGGSVLPVDRVELNGGQLVLTRVHVAKEKNAAGQEVETRSIETIRATVSGDDLKLTTQTVGPDGQAGAAADFRGRRIPPVPAAPDLAKVRFGSPVVLFNGRDLTGWKLTEARAVNGWSAKDGRASKQLQVAIDEAWHHHAPAAGKPSWICPVFIRTQPGPWVFVFEVIAAMAPTHASSNEPAPHPRNVGSRPSTKPPIRHLARVTARSDVAGDARSDR